MEKLIEEVKSYWEDASCGEKLYMKGETLKNKFRNQQKERYQLEPYILNFADFKSSKGKKILEIGVGLGADHQQFAASGAELFGCDLTNRAIEYTRTRLKLFNLSSTLVTANAENLPFKDEQFDELYSWGVIHHSPNTQKAVNEIYRVLKPNRKAKIMIYHKYSIVGYMLWIRYALMKGKLMRSLEDIYANFLESPGTKAYSRRDAKKLFINFSDVQIKTVLTHGDLLTSKAGQRHTGVFLTIARSIFPRKIIRLMFPTHGLFMLITAKK